MGYGGDIDEYINEGRKEGLKKGREEGRKSTRLEDISILLKNKISTPKQIAKAFNMPLSEVEEIALSVNYQI